MKKVNILIIILVATLAFSSCQEKHYAVSSIEASRIEMDSTWDAKADPQMVELVNSYSEELHKEMNVEIGTAAQTLVKGFPQSLLTNFTTDAMKEYGTELWGQVDFAVVNNGGLRSTLNKGTITVGDLFEIYSFDNRLVLLELKGKTVNDFFGYIAVNGGEGLSSGIELVVRDRKIESLKIGGQPVDEERIYRVATLDFLAEGNSGMGAFTHAVNYIDSNVTLRDAMIEQVKKTTAANKEVDASLDNRIKVYPEKSADK